MSIERVVGFLSSGRISPVLSADALAAAVARACEIARCSLTMKVIDAEELVDTPDVDVLVHGLGPAFHDDAWHHVHAFFRRGGHLLTLGCNPLTQPYRVVDDRVLEADTTDAALHSLGLIDTCHPTGPFESPQPGDVAPRFHFLARTPLPPMSATCAMDVRLATRPEPDGVLYARHGEREADLEVGCRLYDAGGRAVTSPVLRMNHFDGGRLTCLNFDPADPRYWESTPGRDLLAAVIATALQETWHVDLTSTFARYVPGEPIAVSATGRRLAGDQSGAQRSLELALYDADRAAEEPRAVHREEIAGDTVEVNWPLRELAEGCYTVLARLHVERQCIQEWRTGFYVVSEEQAKTLAAGAPRLRVDPSIAPDFCVVDDRPFPMTGTTYMARDNFRDCFAELNVAYARDDLKALRELGANIIRAGVWTTYDRVYDPAGGFSEAALRSMDAYFLCAAEAGLPVQFVPSAFVMNCWNREASVFHDPDLRAKAMLAFKQFAGRYADWPGVQLDMINEPSYAPFKQGQLWQTAKPIGDPHELKAWRQWLRDRYDGDISALRSAWAVSAVELPDFDSATMPVEGEYATNYDGPPDYTRRSMLADFYAFADDTFTDWTGEIRRIVRNAAPEMIVMLGRDEWFRVPTQQRDAFEGNIDIVNWHQWHWEGTIFNEYNLNRVRGMVCCGQEMGVLPYKDQRNEERLSELDIHHQLERKLIYCMGNWIQWQSHSDPVMDIYKENKLGLIRVDGTERPGTDLLWLLGWLERHMAVHLAGRREAHERLMVVVPTSTWFSSDKHLAQRATMQAFAALFYRLNQPAYTVLEHLLRPDNDRQIGDPALIIAPSMTAISQPAWDELLRRVRASGATLLLTGSPEQDEYWRMRGRLKDLGIDAPAKNMATVERLRIAAQEFDCTFREAIRHGLPGKGLLRCVPGDAAVARLVEAPLGDGRVIYCPIPVELADDIDATVRLYQAAIASSYAQLHPLVEVSDADNSAAQLIYAVDYRGATAVSLINEGADATCRFRLVNSGVEVEAELGAGRAARIYVSHAGQLLGGYAHAPIRVGDDKLEIKGDLAFARTDTGWQTRPGRRAMESGGQDTAWDPQHGLRRL